MGETGIEKERESKGGGGDIKIKEGRKEESGTLSKKTIAKKYTDKVGQEILK